MDIFWNYTLVVLPSVQLISFIGITSDFSFHVFWMIILYCIVLLLQDIFPDKASERRILSYSVRCPFGCPWTGELRDVEVRSWYTCIAYNKCALIAIESGSRALRSSQLKCWK